jgi:hypothetical protein
MADTLTSVSIPEGQLLMDAVDTPMTPVERVVRGLVIGGFLALLGFEAYMIWRALIVL